LTAFTELRAALLAPFASSFPPPRADFFAPSPAFAKKIKKFYLRVLSFSKPRR
jgi:hypothetical protein